MSLLDISVAARVAVLTLDDPGRRNALSLELVSEIVEALDDLESRDDVGALVVTGTAPAFCAGADLSDLGDSQRDGLNRIYEGFLRFSRSPLPTIAAVNGAAVGAGMNLALSCDVRLAGASARFDTRFVQLGIHPGGGHTWMMRRAVGPQATAAMVLFGEVLDATEAERVGLVWRAVPDDQLLDTARQLAARAAACPAELVRRTKATIVAMATVDDHDTAVERELETQVWSMGEPDFRARLEGLQRRISRPDDGSVDPVTE